MDYESDQHQYLLLVRAEENEEQLSSAAEVGAHSWQSVYFHFSTAFPDLCTDSLGAPISPDHAVCSVVHSRSLSVYGLDIEDWFRYSWSSLLQMLKRLFLRDQCATHQRSYLGRDRNIRSQARDFVLL